MFTVLATFAGVVGYLKKHYRNFKWQYFFIESLASGLVGLLITLICLSSNIDPYLTGAVAGIAGFLGADTVKHLLYGFVKSRSGIDIEDNKNPQ